MCQCRPRTLRVRVPERDSAASAARRSDAEGIAVMSKAIESFDRFLSLNLYIVGKTCVEHLFLYRTNSFFSKLVTVGYYLTHNSDRYKILN